MKTILFLVLTISSTAFAKSASIQLSKDQKTSANITALMLIDSEVQKALASSDISNISVATTVKTNETIYRYSITNSKLNADITGKYTGSLPDCTTTVTVKIQGGVAPIYDFSVEDVDQNCAMSMVGPGGAG